MPRSLLIAIRFHEGRYHGQQDRFSSADGWPPSPGRLFQALVAGAASGARLQTKDERALKWLECLAPPRIAAPTARRGRAVKVFVPSNDLDSVGGDPARVSEIRVGKYWRPYFFDPEESVPLRLGLRVRGTGSSAHLRNRRGAVPTRKGHRHGVGERPNPGSGRSGCPSRVSSGTLANPQRYGRDSNPTSRQPRQPRR